ncbi:MAG: A/G-specific adenine glycosylase [Candidatus Omnitrophica bacterium]|nr:A/G-specific adenine glycosylase [Candidatus Omnitrophota bacterium]
MLEWFDRNQRPLPWRRKYLPYPVWVSEVMLQQTQVDTALPYYKRWLALFPTIRSLAESDEKKVLKAWEGLGYYSRARNFHKAAKIVMEKHEGLFPEKYEDILALPGIGRYTAGAIASIAFNQEKPIVDGNVLRVLARVYAISKPIDDMANREEFWRLQKKLIPKDQARNFNQALMELGALVCASKNPACAVCPIQKNCLAFKKGRAEAYPVRQKKKEMIKVTASAVVFRPRHYVHQRPVGEIMGGLWEFPEWKLVKNGRLSPEIIEELTAKHIENEFGFKPAKLKTLGTIKRNYTHHLETLWVFESSVIPSPLKGINSVEGSTKRQSWPSAWITKEEFSDYPFSSAHAKIAKMVSPARTGREFELEIQS